MAKYLNAPKNMPFPGIPCSLFKQKELRLWPSSQRLFYFYFHDIFH